VGTRSAILRTVVLIIVVAAAIAMVLALSTMLLWNWLMPDIFGLKTISFWQALGLLLLTTLLFRSGSHASRSSRD